MMMIDYAAIAFLKQIRTLQSILSKIQVPIFIFIYSCDIRAGVNHI